MSMPDQSVLAVDVGAFRLWDPDMPSPPR